MPDEAVGGEQAERVDDEDRRHGERDHDDAERRRHGSTTALRGLAQRPKRDWISCQIVTESADARDEKEEQNEPEANPGAPRALAVLDPRLAAGTMQAHRLPDALVIDDGNVLRFQLTQRLGHGSEV